MGLSLTDASSWASLSLWQVVKLGIALGLVLGVAVVLWQRARRGG